MVPSKPSQKPSPSRPGFCGGQGHVRVKRHGRCRTKRTLLAAGAAVEERSMHGGLLALQTCYILLGARLSLACRPIRGHVASWVQAGGCPAAVTPVSCRCMQPISLTRWPWGSSIEGVRVASRRCEGRDICQRRSLRERVQQPSSVAPLPRAESLPSQRAI